jgi:hypothetical protein
MSPTSPLLSLDRIAILYVFDVDAGTIHVPFRCADVATTRATVLLSLQLDATLRLLRRVPKGGFVIDAPCVGSRALA